MEISLQIISWLQGLLGNSLSWVAMLVTGYVVYESSHYIRNKWRDRKSLGGIYYGLSFVMTCCSVFLVHIALLSNSSEHMPKETIVVSDKAEMNLDMLDGYESTVSVRGVELE